MPASSKTSKIGYYWIPISHNRIKIGWKRVLEGVQKWPNIVWKYYFHTKLSDLNLFLVCFMISATKWLHCNHLTPIIFHCATVVVTINDPFFGKKITQNKKTFITQSKCMIFWWNKKFLKAFKHLLVFLQKNLFLIFSKAHAGPFFAQVGPKNK